jgi:hypothetical protein
MTMPQYPFADQIKINELDAENNASAALDDVILENQKYYESIRAARKRIKSGSRDNADIQLASQLIPEHEEYSNDWLGRRKIKDHGDVGERWWQTLGESSWEGIKAIWESPDDRLRQEQEEIMDKWSKASGISLPKEPLVKEMPSIVPTSPNNIRLPQIPLTHEEGLETDKVMALLTALPMGGMGRALSGTLRSSALDEAEKFLAKGLTKSARKEISKLSGQEIIDAYKLKVSEATKQLGGVDKNGLLTKLQGIGRNLGVPEEDLNAIFEISTRAGQEQFKDKFLRDFGELAASVSSKEKNVAGKMSPEDTALMDKDWKAFSRQRGYTEDEIDEYQRFLDMYAEGKRLGIPEAEMQEVDFLAQEAKTSMPSGTMNFAGATQTPMKVTTQQLWDSMSAEERKLWAKQANIKSEEVSATWNTLPKNSQRAIQDVRYDLTETVAKKGAKTAEPSTTIALPKTGEPRDFYIFRGESPNKPYFKQAEYGSGKYYYADGTVTGQARISAKAYAAGNPESKLTEEALDQAILAVKGRVKEEFVHFKNPYVIGEAGDKLTKQVTSAAKTRAKQLGLTGDEYDKYVADAIPKALKKRGYDGLVVIKADGTLEVIPYDAEIKKASEALLTPTPKMTLESAVNKVTNVIREELKPAQKRIQDDYNKLYAVKISKYYHTEKALKDKVDSGAMSATEALNRMQSQLKGKIDTFETSLGKRLTKEEKDRLYQEIFDRNIPGYNKQHVKDALDALLERNAIPHQKDLEAMEDLYGIEFAKAIISQKPFSDRFWTEFFDIMNAPRSVLSSMDLSAPLRQGLVLAPTHPKEWLASWSWMFKALSSEENAIKLNNILIGRNITDKTLIVAADKRIAAGLFHHDLASEIKLITAREEMYASNFLRKIPVAGQLIKMSERTYVTFLNKLRADVFDSVVRNWERSGKAIKQVDLVELARYINRATGRGELTTGEYAYQGSKLMRSPYGGAANLLFFSPRLQTSRVLLPFTAIFNKSPAVRNLAQKDLAIFAGTMGTLLSLLSFLPGVTVEKNPTSTDFGRVRIGNTRIDVLGGYQPWIRFAFKMMTGEEKKVGGSEVPINRAWSALSFARTKVNPWVGQMWDLASGKTPTGQEVETPWGAIEKNDPEAWKTLMYQTMQNYSPLFLQDLAGALQQEGLMGAAYAAPGFFGAGVLSYDSSMQITAEVRALYSQSREEMREYEELLGKDSAKAEKFANENSLIKYSEVLAQNVSYINKIEKAIKQIEDDDTLSDEQKDSAIEEYRRAIIQTSRDVINMLQGLPTSQTVTNDSNANRRESPLDNVGK